MTTGRNTTTTEETVNATLKVDGIPGKPTKNSTKSNSITNLAKMTQPKIVWLVSSLLGRKSIPESISNALMVKPEEGGMAPTTSACTQLVVKISPVSTTALLQMVSSTGSSSTLQPLPSRSVMNLM